MNVDPAKLSKRGLRKAPQRVVTARGSLKLIKMSERRASHVLGDVTSFIRVLLTSAPGSDYTISHRVRSGNRSATDTFRVLVRRKATLGLTLTNHRPCPQTVKKRYRRNTAGAVKLVEKMLFLYHVTLQGPIDVPVIHIRVRDWKFVDHDNTVTKLVSPDPGLRDRKKQEVGEREM